LIFSHNEKDYKEKPKKSQDPQRLSGLNISKTGVCDSPNHFERFGGGNNKTSRLDFSRSLNVTDCRETQDVLQRDNLESTASIVNCVGGGNGKMIAVLKSDLIDLELLAA